MNLFLKLVNTLTLIILLPVANVHADTVLLKNGDTLIGEILNNYFALQAPYGQLTVKRSFCKNIIMDDNQEFAGSLKTINNDLLSGNIMNKEVQMLLANQARQTVKFSAIKSLFFYISGPSQPAMTTIFTMQGGDRFSGNLLNPEIKILTDYMTATYRPAEINRIEFADHDTKDDSLFLTNGDLLYGKLMLDQLSIEPDSIARLSTDKSKFGSIQFNARKMLLKEYRNLPSSEKDQDGDGVPDDADNCRNTPWGVQVDENGCSSGNTVAKTVSQSKPTSLPRQDKDGDGVMDDADKCPQTPRGAQVDNRGCWSINDILFDFDSTVIKSRYYPALDDVFAVLINNPLLKIKIQGSTDNIGSAEYNRQLSDKRAQTVKRYLVEKGIEPQRLKAVGLGSTRQAASNDTPAGRALNRRIDFVLME
jgi:outer membrane protein OmpA-like peptidoglycan-associated protein